MVKSLSKVMCYSVAAAVLNAFLFFLSFGFSMVCGDIGPQCKPSYTAQFAISIVTFPTNKLSFDARNYLWHFFGHSLWDLIAIMTINAIFWGVIAFGLAWTLTHYRSLRAKR
jgi:hypothetical protein